MAKRQLNARSLRFVDDYGLRSRIHFWVDPDSRAIDELGLRRPKPEPIEEGVPPCCSTATASCASPTCARTTTSGSTRRW
jgi:hypothetical protein